LERQFASKTEATAPGTVTTADRSKSGVVGSAYARAMKERGVAKRRRRIGNEGWEKRSERGSDGGAAMIA
jgi:hypothetical protein